MFPSRLISFALLLCGVPAGVLCAQELEPGAYSPSPVNFNIAGGAVVFNSGDLAFDPAGPISDASASIGVGSFGYVRTLGVFGRSANLGFAIPYIIGDLEGSYLGEHRNVSRAGFGDPRLRFAINFHGAPAMTVREFAAYRPRWNVGASLVVTPPWGRYSSDRLINIGTNRWGFKPEIGITRAVGRWTLEGYAGVWLFTDNSDFFGGQTRAQEALGSFQFHAVYTIRPRMWLAYNANYYTGGRTSIDGVKNEDLQENSRMGLTLAIPLSRSQSIKVAYSRGAFTTIGADFDSIAIAWQRVWGGK